jgi:ribosome biogenesis GTPase
MNIKHNIKNLGWNENLEREFSKYKDLYTVGRIAVEYKHIYKVYLEEGEALASVSGKMNYGAVSREDYPAVGDWVVIDKVNSIVDRAFIHVILKRKSKFSRKYAGESTDEQIIATNVDIVFICMSLNDNFNLRRLERYIAAAWDSGARPVVVLTKADLCQDIEEKISQVSEVAIGIDVLCVSAVKKIGIENIKSYIKPGVTVAFLGSSGIGKSTIINELIGENIQETQEVSIIESKGKHTTTNRELIELPDGGVVIDTPGMREFHIMDVEESLDNTFEDIENLALKCKFSDCSHTSEPKCAVREAIENGTLSISRYENYLKLKKEAEFIKRKTDKKSEIEYKNYMKSITKRR